MSATPNPNEVADSSGLTAEEEKKRRKQEKKDIALAMKLQKEETGQIQIGDQIEISRPGGRWVRGVAVARGKKKTHFIVRFEDEGRTQQQDFSRKQLRPVIGGTRRAPPPQDSDAVMLETLREAIRAGMDPTTMNLSPEVLRQLGYGHLAPAPAARRGGVGRAAGPQAGYTQGMGSRSRPDQHLAGHRQHSMASNPHATASVVEPVDCLGELVDMGLPAYTDIETVIPPNAYAGAAIELKLPSGDRTRVALPAGVQPGQRVTLRVPTPEPDFLLVRFIVPEGKVAGSVVTISVPGRNAPFRVQVPEGVGPGMQIQAAAENHAKRHNSAAASAQAAGHRPQPAMPRVQAREQPTPSQPEPKLELTAEQQAFLDSMPADIQKELLGNQRALAEMLGVPWPPPESNESTAAAAALAPAPATSEGGSSTTAPVAESSVVSSPSTASPAAAASAAPAPAVPPAIPQRTSSRSRASSVSSPVPPTRSAASHKTDSAAKEAATAVASLSLTDGNTAEEHPSLPEAAPAPVPKPAPAPAPVPAPAKVSDEVNASVSATASVAAEAAASHASDRSTTPSTSRRSSRSGRSPSPAAMTEDEIEARRQQHAARREARRRARAGKSVINARSTPSSAVTRPPRAVRAKPATGGPSAAPASAPKPASARATPQSPFRASRLSEEAAEAEAAAARAAGRAADAAAEAEAAAAAAAEAKRKEAEEDAEPLQVPGLVSTGSRSADREKIKRKLEALKEDYSDGKVPVAEFNRLRRTYLTQLSHLVRGRSSNGSLLQSPRSKNM
eukprot:INCI7883.2.p1 GENE.INCI7883.2~~INCI7883.2.p1  ORF type:complete len:787 (-),score=130.50 INCI7883.2:71-2431(-)